MEETHCSHSGWTKTKCNKDSTPKAYFLVLLKKLFEFKLTPIYVTTGKSLLLLKLFTPQLGAKLQDYSLKQTNTTNILRSRGTVVKLMQYDPSLGKAFIISCIVQLPHQYLLHKRLLNVWVTAKDNSSSYMFLPAAQSFVFLYGNVRAERWLPSGLPVSKLTRNSEKDFIPYMERSSHSDGLTLPGDHMPGNKTKFTVQ